MAQTLRRQVGTGGAVLLGLGSMVGTGVFVGLGLAAGEVQTGAELTLAIVLAGGLALCNALSSAQLAAAHPVAGGTYAYGRRYLTPWAGAAAGWLFLFAKSASAAAAALAASSYLLAQVAPEAADSGIGFGLRIPIALGMVGCLTVVVLEGIRRSVAVNAGIVAVTVASLCMFVIGVGWFGRAHLSGWQTGGILQPVEPEGGFFAAVALSFVAFTGYGRIATLAEEVREPRRTIPAAVFVTVGVTVLLYAAVAIAAVHVSGVQLLAAVSRESGAPLLDLIGLQRYLNDSPFLAVASVMVALGAGVAMLGVLMNLLLGLSRVVLAMGRTGDLPGKLAEVDATGTTPGPAVVTVAVIVAALVLTGSVKLAWSLSAASVLAYYAITNAAALRLPREDRRYPRAVAAAGLFGCSALAFTLPVWAWGAMLGVAGAGALVHRFAGAGRRGPSEV